MSAAADTRPLLVRFFDSFLQEQNIKWILITGMMILLGSSLMLVTTQWGTYAGIWKYLILLGYTAVIHAAGQVAYHRFGLRKTGTVLMALMVLLMPVLFLALHWVGNIGWETAHARVSWICLLAVTLLFAGPAAARVFSHFLRGSQPTFLASYLILCLAGAVAPTFAAQWSAWAALALWAVFTAGVIKVNRHVFWLTEEYRKPRIFGFFPIVLLGGLFLTLYAVYFARHMMLDWMGLGCVLVAVPVLLTADAVARVFQQRTGDLVRPLPWSIIMPLGLGIVLCAAGVCLAGTGFAYQGGPDALVPTTAVAAALMAVVAHRTGKKAFVWAMIAGVVMAYQFSPVFFRELAIKLLNIGADAIHEQRLPYAFYGLTYLPLLLATTIFSALAARRKRDLFAQPLRQFSIALAILLTLLSFGHDKALLPVGLVMTAMFALQARLFTNRKFVLAAVAAFVIAAAGFTPFAERVLDLPLPPGSSLLCIVIAAGLLLFPGTLIDRLSQRLPLPPQTARGLRDPDEVWQAPCRFASLVLSLTVPIVWMIQQFVFLGEPRAWLSGAAAFALLLIHAWRWRDQAAIRSAVLVVANWQIVAATLLVFLVDVPSVLQITDAVLMPIWLPLAFVAAASLCVWQVLFDSDELPAAEIAFIQRWGLRLLLALALVSSLDMQRLEPVHIPLAAAAFALAAFAELWSACRRQAIERVWIAEAIAATAVAYLALFGVITFGRGVSMFIVLAVGVLLWVLGRWAQRNPATRILAQPFQLTGLWMPLAAVGIGVVRHFNYANPAWLGMNSLALLLAGGFYFWRGLEQKNNRGWFILSALVLNVALVLLWQDLTWTDPQFYMVPLGISILVIFRLLKREIPEILHDPIRYAGALVILVSPTFHIVEGSWLHLFMLMVLSVGVIFVSMGFRVRALIYTGTAFLVADLLAMVVRGSIDQPSVLWIAGLMLGGSVVALGAICENHREVLLQRLRVVSAALKTWQ